MGLIQAPAVARATNDSRVEHWLLSGDVSVTFQVHRDLIGADGRTLAALQRRIELEGWGRRLLRLRNSNGHWGRGPYQPKWTSTHYTLVELKEMGVSPANRECRQSASLLLEEKEGEDGGINYAHCARALGFSDVCVNGMLLNVASSFVPNHAKVPLVVDFLLNCQLPDGGWNCLYRTGALHSSMHTTVSVLEGLQCYCASGQTFRIPMIEEAIEGGIEFLLRHRMFRSHRTGTIIRSGMLQLSFPCRWYYDILRGLECLRLLGGQYDTRLEDALGIVLRKRGPDGRWPLQSPHPGQIHFKMEQSNRPSRWNTLRAMRVLRYFDRMKEGCSHEPR